MKKTKTGKFVPKNKSKYAGDFTNIVYRSSWEKRSFKWCDDNPEIEKWNSEEIVIPYLYEADKQYHRYFVDLWIKFKSGKILLVEIKPKSQTKKPKYPGRKTQRYLNESLTYIKNCNKWNAAEKISKKKGWEFQIWTEETLRKMGILPKGLKPLKKFRRKK